MERGAKFLKPVVRETDGEMENSGRERQMERWGGETQRWRAR